MCGVFAVLSPDRPVQREPVAAALRAMAHRGPDGSGQWRSPDGRVALGHVRLAIRGGSAQPLCDARGRAATLNGELYGVSVPEGESDSAALLPLVAQHGEGCPTQLRGEFAFACWDAPRGQLIAARDPFGIKPLHVCRWEGQLLLASEVKALAAYGVPLRWDEGAVMSWLMTGMLPRGRTLLAGIEVLPPGHVLVARGDQHQLQRWWQPTLSTAEAPDRLAHIRPALEDAVIVRLAADRPIAVALSGGIDSSLVLSVAARHAPVSAFSVGFAGEADELPQAAAFARTLGVPFHGLELTAAQLADSYLATVSAVEGPLLNTHAVARFRLAQAVRRAGCSVLLTGDGGDELFGGYPHLVQDALRSRGDVTGLAGLSASPDDGLLLDRSDAPNPAWAALPSFVQARMHAGRGLRQLLSRSALPRWDAEVLLAGVLESLSLPAGLEERGPVERAMQLWAATVLPGYLLPALGDRVELAHGVEGRQPLLDVRLAACAGRLTEDERVRGTTDKWALREAARGRLPAAICARPKRAFLAPPIAARPGPLRDLLCDTLSGAAGQRLPCLSPLRLQMLVELGLPEDNPAHAAAADPVLNAALSLALLGEALKISA